MRNLAVAVTLVVLVSGIADATHTQKFFSGVHLTLMPRVPPPAVMPAPRYTPSGNFQTIDNTLASMPSSGMIEFPYADVAIEPRAASVWGQYQSTTCWSRTGNDFRVLRFLWLDADSGGWPSTWTEWLAAGKIWYDSKSDMDRFLLTIQNFEVVGWVKYEPELGHYVIRWQSLDNNASALYKGVDIGWSGPVSVAPGTPPCP